MVAIQLTSPSASQLVASTKDGIEAEIRHRLASFLSRELSLRRFHLEIFVSRNHCTEGRSRTPSQSASRRPQTTIELRALEAHRIETTATVEFEIL